MESNMDINQFPNVMAVGHAIFHRTEEPTPDSPTLMAALTERDVVVLGLALPALEWAYLTLFGIPCFHDSSVDLQLRLLELVKAQHPEWIERTNEGLEDLTTEDTNDTA